MSSSKEKKVNFLKSIISKIKLSNAGHKETFIPSLTKSSKNRIYYPHLNLDVKQCPDLKGKEVDDDCTFIIKGKITGHELYENDNRSNESYNIEIRNIGIVNK